MSAFTESVVEEAALGWLAAIGWRVARGPDIAPDTLAAERRDYSEVVLAQRLRDALARLNPTLPAEALDDAFRKLTRPEGAELVARSRALHRLLVDGVTVEYRTAAGEIRGAQARVIDFDQPSANDWLAVNQFSVTENKHARRPDMVLFVNGLPLAVVELKNAADESATLWSAWQQLQTYKGEIASLFATNALLVISDGVEARVGTLTGGREWFKPWRTIAGEGLADPHLPELQVVIEGLCVPRDASSIWCATSSSTRTTAAAASRRRWPATTSSTRCRWRCARRCVRPSCAARATGSPSPPAATRPAGSRAVRPATGASAWSGTRRVRARA